MSDDRILTADELAKHGIYIRPIQPTYEPHVRFYVCKPCPDQHWAYWNPRPGEGWKNTYGEAAGYHRFSDALSAASKLVAKEAEPKEPVIQVRRVWRHGAIEEMAQPEWMPMQEGEHRVIGRMAIVDHPDGRVEVKEVVPDEVIRCVELGMDKARADSLEVIIDWYRTANAVAAKVTEATP